MSDDELLDALDEDGLVVAQKTRAQVHADDDWHGIVFVWAAWQADGHRRMLLQRRSAEGFPGGIDALAGGHMLSGETPVDGARRELREEVGLVARADDFVPLGSSPMRRPFGNCRRVHQHLLLYRLPLDIAHMQFSDEVDGFVDVDLAGFGDLVHHRISSLPARARFMQVEDGRLHDTDLPAAAVLSYPDEILETFRRSLCAIDVWLRDGRVNPAHY